MEFFAALSLLIALVLLAPVVLRRRILEPPAQRKILTLLLIGLVLHYPVSELFGIGGYLAIVARPVGFVFGLLSFRELCLAINGQAPQDGQSGSAS